MDSDVHLAICNIHEKIGAVTATATSAHSRMDEMKLLVKEDLSEIKDSMREFGSDLKTITAWMNHTKGYIAGLVLASGLLGGLISVGGQWAIDHWLQSKDSKAQSKVHLESSE